MGAQPMTKGGQTVTVKFLRRGDAPTTDATLPKVTFTVDAIRGREELYQRATEELARQNVLPEEVEASQWKPFQTTLH